MRRTADRKRNEESYERTANLTNNRICRTQKKPEIRKKIEF
jgi:hypothetical protein